MTKKLTPYQRTKHKRNCCWMLAKDFGYGPEFFGSTASYTKKGAREKAVGPFEQGKFTKWETWRDDGYYIARVQIKEVK